MHIVNDCVCPEQINDIKLNIFRYGRAIVENTWHGNVTNSVFSRLYFVKSGSFYITKDGKKTLLTEGNWYLVPNGFSYDFGCDCATEHLFFHFNMSGFAETDIFKNQKNILVLSTLADKAEQLDYLIDSSSTTDALYTKNILFEIVIGIIKKYEINIEQGNYSPCVIKAVDFIRSNLSETLTIRKIAQSIFVSESSLTKHFRRELGTSVNKYIDESILVRSAQLITETTLSVREISEAFGFCDQFYFSRKFKARFGQSPLGYKKTRTV